MTAICTYTFLMICSWVAWATWDIGILRFAGWFFFAMTVLTVLWIWLRDRRHNRAQREVSADRTRW